MSRRGIVLRDKAKLSVLIHEPALLFELYGFRNNSGGLAILAAILRAFIAREQFGR